MSLRKIQSVELRGKQVFLRTDLNVPINNGIIEQDFRLRSAIPTLRHIIENGGKVVLATHIGRPSAVGKPHLYDESLSTKQLLPWFEKQGFQIEYENDLVAAHHKSKQHFNKILLLENLRFYNSECQTNHHFAELLACLGSVYINDAFSLLHRNNTSVTLLPQEFEHTHRAIGLLMEKEIKEMTKLRENKTDDLVIFIGGNKIKDKIPMIERFMDKKNHPNLKSICLGGGIGLAFLKSQGYEAGQGKIDDDTVATAQKILTLAKENQIKLLLPVDHRVSFPGKQDLEIVDISYKVPDHGTCVDIGPNTLNLFTQELQQAKIIFNNGTMGIYEQSACRLGTCGILGAIANAPGYSVVGGGNTSSAVHACNLQSDIDFISTGGGATLAFLGCKDPEEDLPALASLLD